MSEKRTNPEIAEIDAQRQSLRRLESGNNMSINCSLRISLQDAEKRLSEQLERGSRMLVCLEDITQGALSRPGYDNEPSSEDRKKFSSLWADYSRWNDFNKELLRRSFDSPAIAVEYDVFREPEPTYEVFAAEVKKLQNVVTQDVRRLSSIKDRLPLFDEIQTLPASASNEGKQVIFIGHGHSREWLALQAFLKDRLDLRCVEFNTVSAAGIGTAERLSELLAEATFAFLVMTAEDELADGSKHARENVVHEAGLFQGRLTFRRAIVFLEKGCSEFSNVHGLGQIRFERGKIESGFEDVRKVLEREKIVPLGGADD